MSRSNRLFEIIQLLRAARKPLTAHGLAEALEVGSRTIYRDIAALQAMRVPIAGEAGIGYVMRAGFDLPPLMFTTEEVEAIVVGLALLKRTGDVGLQGAAETIGAKIAAVLPGDRDGDLTDLPFYVSSWGAGVPGCRDPSTCEACAVRSAQKRNCASPMKTTMRGARGGSSSRSPSSITSRLWY